MGARNSFILLGGLLSGCVGGPAETKDARCVRNDDCGAGEVCVEVCRRVCVENVDCGEDLVCVEGACHGASPGVPNIRLVEGNGNSGTDHVRDRLIVSGEHFTSATFSLDDVELALEELSDTRVVALLPTTVVAGLHTLAVANQLGTDQTSVNLLADPATPDEVLALLVQADGVGSGLDADLLDGHHASYFVTQTDLTSVLSPYVTTSGLATSLSEYAQLTDLDGMVTADGSGDVAVSGDVVFSPPKQSFVQVLPIDFHPSGDPDLHAIGRDWLNGVYSVAGQSNAVYAAVHLPHGSVITSFACRLDDRSGAGDAGVVFYRQIWSGGTQEQISSLSSNGSSSTTNAQFSGAITASRATVNNDAYWYYLYGTFGGVDGTTVMIRRCKVGYTYDRL